MQFNTKTRYSLRILIQLGLNATKCPIKAKKISKQQNIPMPYLEQIMFVLKSAGIVKASRGCNGGYTLCKDIKAISALDVIELFEGKVEFSTCAGESKCMAMESCYSSHVWKRLNQIFKKEAKRLTLKSIIENINTEKIEEYII